MRTNFEINENKQLSLILLDAEGDEIMCGFNHDGCVNIYTDNLTYMDLSKENLEELLLAIDEAEEYYNNLPQEVWDNME